MQTIKALKALKALRRWREELGGIPLGFNPSFNIAPTAKVIAMRSNRKAMEFCTVRWGLIPYWWKDAESLPTATFNARAETIDSKSAFKAAFTRSRCMIPVDGFYEWKVVGRKTKQPYFIHPNPPEDVLALAGLWDKWETDVGSIESCTVITTTPNSLMAAIYDRMSVILSPEVFEEWLDPANHDTGRLRKLLVPCDSSLIAGYPVGPVRGEGPELVMPVT